MPPDDMTIDFEPTSDSIPGPDPIATRRSNVPANPIDLAGGTWFLARPVLRFAPRFTGDPGNPVKIATFLGYRPEATHCLRNLQTAISENPDLVPIHLVLGLAGALLREAHAISWAEACSLCECSESEATRFLELISEAIRPETADPPAAEVLDVEDLPEVLE